MEQLSTGPLKKGIRAVLQDVLYREFTCHILGSFIFNTTARVGFFNNLADKGWFAMGSPQEDDGSPRPLFLDQFILNNEL